LLDKGGSHAKEQPKLLGTIENQLGIRKWLEEKGHTYVVTDDKDGPNSTFEKELPDADIVISQPFHPAYMTRERFDKAKNLKVCITAGIGSDHVDLNAANDHKVGVYEVTGSNVVSVAEHVLMTILTLVRNYNPAHEQILAGDWNVAAVAKHSYDLENKVVATVGVGRIGERVLRRLKPFDCKELLYYDYAQLDPKVEQEIGCRRVESLEEMVSQADVVTINCPLHEGTKGLFNKDLISKMKKGAYLVNTARGAICVAEDVAEAVRSGQLGGYGGDVWPRQPAPSDHPWRSMFINGERERGGNAMTPHISGTSLDAQARYAKGTKDILDNFFNGTKQRPSDVIVENGEYASKAYGEREKLKEKQKDFQAYAERSNMS
jgi:formate dehydrogenase